MLLYADSVTLPAFAALSPVVQQATIDVLRTPGPQQQTRRSGVWRPNDGTVTQTDGRTDKRPTVYCPFIIITTTIRAK